MKKFITTITQKIEYMAARNSFVYEIVALYYKDIVKKEAELADIRENDRVLCIGGGACPFSAIMLHRLTRAKITVIDNNLNCVLVSRHAISQMGYSNSIEILYDDGCTIDPYKSSVVHLALQVCPLEQVFQTVKDRVAPGTRILVRKPKESIKELYSDMNIGMFQGCKRITHKYLCNLGETILYQKRELGHETKMDMAKYRDCLSDSYSIKD